MSGAHARPLLDKAVFQAVLELLVERYNSLTPAEQATWCCKPSHILKVVCGQTDNQNVVCAVSFWGFKELSDR